MADFGADPFAETPRKTPGTGAMDFGPDPFGPDPFADEVLTKKPEKAGYWSTVGSNMASDLAEPFRLVGEAAVAPINAVKRGYEGLQGIGATVGAYAGGATLDEALQEGSRQIGPRRDIPAPFGPSKTMQHIGQNYITPVMNQAKKIPGVGDYVEPALEAGGDIASLMALNPMLSAGKGTFKAGMKAVGETQAPERLYASAIKLPLSKKWTRELGPDGMTKRKEAVRAGLDGEVPPTEFGVAKAKNLEKSFRGKVDAVVAELDNSGGLIPKEKLRAGLEDAYSVAGTEGTAAAERIVNSLYDKRFEKWGQMVKTGEQTIPEKKGMFGEVIEPARVEPIMERQYKPSEMQAIKRHLYKMENYERAKLSRGLGSQLKELGNKGMAHEAKVALEELHPELKNLNRQDAAYVGLVDALETSVPKLQNRDIAGIGAKILLAGSHPVLGLVEHLVGLPRVKARLAFALNKARKAPPLPVAGDMAKAMGLSAAATLAPKPDAMSDDDLRKALEAQYGMGVE